MNGFYFFHGTIPDGRPRIWFVHTNETKATETVLKKIIQRLELTDNWNSRMKLLYYLKPGTCECTKEDDFYHCTVKKENGGWEGIYSRKNPVIEAT